jgi:GDP-L-fucose synthase
LIEKVIPLERDSKIYLAGHTGLAGSAILRALNKRGFENVYTVSSKDLDLTNRTATFEYLSSVKPECVIIAAAKVGGIIANRDFPAEFLSKNLQIQTNLMDASANQKVKRLLFLGSSCIYPRDTAQPISEDQLLTGPLEQTNLPYAVAKIAGLAQVQSIRNQHGLKWISAMPTNLYGPGDNFDPVTSHVFAALVKRYVDATNNQLPHVTNWGTGTARREFLHSDDFADACLFLIDNYDSNQHINVGTGSDIQLRELATMISKAIGYQGETLWDSSKPDGTPRKLLNVSKLSELGWKSKISIREGIEMTIEHYTKNHN